MPRIEAATDGPNEAPCGLSVHVRRAVGDLRQVGLALRLHRRGVDRGDRQRRVLQVLLRGTAR